MTKKLALLVVVLFAAASAALMVQSFHGSSRAREKSLPTAGGTSSTPPQDVSESEKVKESDVSTRAAALKEALGTDDGFACAIFFAGDLTGNLETCG